MDLLVARDFLFRNGLRLEPDETETFAIIERLTAGRMGRDEPALWL
jgi:hypothetical protein